MLGIELEIGNEILKSLPEEINGLKKDASADQVASAGYGWTGLTIQRNYYNSDDQELQVLIANNSVMHASTSYFLVNGGYNTNTGEEQNWKKTNIKGREAVISYDDYEGYSLSVPIGQTSFLVFKAVNFKDEDEVMKAAEKIDIEFIMKKLGEQ